MKKSQASADTAPQVEPKPRPVCSACGFYDPVGGVDLSHRCQLCAITESKSEVVVFMSKCFNRLRRDILSGHES